MDGTEHAEMMIDCRKGLKRWGKKDFQAWVENALWDGQYELPVDGLCHYQGETEIHGIEILDFSADAWDDDKINVNVRLNVTETFHQFSRECDINEERIGILRLAISRQTGEGTVTSCFEESEADMANGH